MAQHVQFYTKVCCSLRSLLKMELFGSFDCFWPVKGLCLFSDFPTLLSLLNKLGSLGGTNRLDGSKLSGLRYQLLMVVDYGYPAALFLEDSEDCGYCSLFY